MVSYKQKQKKTTTRLLKSLAWSIFENEQISIFWDYLKQVL